ncbi:RNA-directed DNA polymerase, eukaryota, reverse transcriptase zinc-binding domain protein [Tanacetum coccineum]
MENKLSFVSWNKVLASKNKGGLGVSSFFAMNRALMFKWFEDLKLTTSLWAKFILAIIERDGIDLLGFIKKNIGNGVDTLFWEDTRKGDIAFKFLYPRIYKLETCKQINVASKLVHDSVRLSLCLMPRGGVELEQFTDMINSLADFQLPNMQDRWFWSLSGSGDFSVASVRKIIDDHLLLKVSSKFSWRKMVPIKVNILAWKVKLDVLPTRCNLSKRGLDINSILCRTIRITADHTYHTLFYLLLSALDINRNIDFLVGCKVSSRFHLLLRSGRCGLPVLLFLRGVNRFLKVLFTLVGGLFGISGIKWCLALPSLQKLLFSTTLWLDPSNGASIGANSNLV